MSHDKAHSEHRPWILATDVRWSEIYSGVCPKSDLWTSKYSLYYRSSQRLASSATLEELDCWSHTVTRLEIQNGACRCVQDSLEQCQRRSWKTGQHGVANCDSPDATGRMNEWKCIDFKCVRKPTNPLSLTYYGNKSSR